MSWRPAKALIALRDEVDRLAPGRDKSSDGIKGDDAHASRKSDHNPNAAGVGLAIDISHDPADGVDTYALAELLRQSRDDRIQYVISNGRIFNASVQAWQWREYRGSNPHTHHMHVSVVSDPARYDDARPWGITLAAPAAGAPKPRPRLRKGDTGEAVRELQKLLGVAVDGIFGDGTRAAVLAVQAARGLDPDGIVGPYTWDVLSDPSPNAPKSVGIMATVFGGAGDPNTGAYDGRPIGDEVLGVALPYRFPGARPRVRVTYQGRSVECAIVDVGPWNIADPYWLHEARPQAESGVDTRGRRTNLAGIDLTPAAARTIGLPGKGRVDWEFVGADASHDHPAPAAPVPAPTPLPAPVPVPSPPVAAPASPIDAILAEIAAVVRPILERAMTDVTNAQLTELIALLKQKNAAAGAAPDLSIIDKVLGGTALVGKKTLIGAVGALFSWGAGKAGVVDPSLIPWDTIAEVFVAFGGFGVLAKLDRGRKAAVPVLKKVVDVLTKIDAALDRAESGTPVAQQGRPENLG